MTSSVDLSVHAKLMAAWSICSCIVKMTIDCNKNKTKIISNTTKRKKLWQIKNDL